MPGGSGGGARDRVRRLEARLDDWTAGFPLMLLLLIPSWASYFALDRPDAGNSHILFYAIPDLHRDPLSIPPALLLTPLVNTQTDQVFLVTVLIAVFGVAVERRVGIVAALAVFWGTSTLAALGSGVLLHALYATVPDAHIVDEAWRRLFNGGSAGGIGLAGALAGIYAGLRRWWVAGALIALFVAWEFTFWAVQLRNFTSTFHLIAFVAGFAALWWLVSAGKLARSGRRGYDHAVSDERTVS